MTNLGFPLRRAAAAAFVLLLLGSAAACSSSDSADKADSGPSSDQVDAEVNGAPDSATIPAGAELVTFTPAETADAAQLDAIATALKDRVRALGLEDVIVEVQDGKVVADVPEGMDKAEVVALGDDHALLFRPALQTFPGAPNDNVTDPKCDAADATPDANCLAIDESDAGATVLLGPAEVDGSVVDTATASPAADDTDSGASGTYQVAVVAKADKKADLNAVANLCNTGDTTCPATDGANGRLAVMLDGTVLVIPTVTTKDVADAALIITGDFTKDEADELAKQIKLASVPLPVPVTAA